MCASEKPRIYWLDNFRTFMVFLVVLLHVAVVYEKTGMGALWWIVCDPCASDVPGILFLILNIFVVATLFFVAGYFASLSLKHKTVGAFLLGKCKRLVLPWAIAVLTLIPLYKVIFLYARDLPQESWADYFYWNSMWNQNWLWFLPVLFLFNVLYAGFSRLPWTLSRLTLKQAVTGGLVLCVLYSVLMDIMGLHGWTKTLLIDFQNERLLIYFVMFLLGAQCHHRGAFVSQWKSNKMDIVIHSTGWIPINLYIFLLIYSLVKPGNFLVSEGVDTLALRFSFVLSLAYLVYAMVTVFRRTLDRQGKISRTLNESSYAVYIIHVVVMGPAAVTMISANVTPLIKLLILTVWTFGVSNGIAWAYKKALNWSLRGRLDVSTMKAAATIALAAMCLAMNGCTDKDGLDSTERPRIALHVAALQGNLTIVQQHIIAQSDLNDRDAYGSSPLIVAATFGKADVARALIEGGADVTVTNNEGATALHIAAFLCRTEIVQALLDNGADKTTLNAAGHTALATAEAPFEAVKGIYSAIEKDLRPLGLKLDYDYIRLTRPKIAAMLR